MGIKKTICFQSTISQMESQSKVIENKRLLYHFTPFQMGKLDVEFVTNFLSNLFFI